jgi:hypothetical protein
MSHDIEENRQELTAAVNSALRTASFRNLKDITPNENLLAIIGSGWYMPVIVPSCKNMPFIQKEQNGQSIYYTLTGRLVALVDGDDYKMEFEQDECSIHSVYEPFEKFIPVFKQKVGGNSS